MSSARFVDENHALALPALPASASPTASCTASLLPAPAGAPAGAGTRVAKADDSGKYVVGQVDVGNFDLKPVLWANGVPQLLDAPGEVSDVLDVNSSGTVVGASLDKEGVDARYPLSTEPHSINSTGDAVVSNDTGESQIVTATGTTRGTFPQSTTIRTLMDRRTDPVGEISSNGDDVRGRLGRLLRRGPLAEVEGQQDNAVRREVVAPVGQCDGA